MIAERPQLEMMASNPEVANPYQCGNNGVLICHLPPGNQRNKHSICIGAAAIPHHIAHHTRGGLGDYLGTCLAESGTGGDTGSDTGESTGGDTGGSTGGDTTDGDTGVPPGENFLDCTDPVNSSNPLCQ